MRKALVLVFVFLILVFSVHAYNSTMGSSHNFLDSSESGFNSLANATAALISPGNPGLVALFAGNFDGDADQEIAYVDKEGVRLYTSALVLEHSADFSSGVSAIGFRGDAYHATTADLNDDGILEIIAVGGNATAVADTGAEIMGWNGSELTSITNIWFSGMVSEFYDGMMVGCDDIRNLCLVVLADSTKGNFRTLINAFNLTANSSSMTTILAHGGSKLHCSPRQRGISIADYDYDGFPEFIWSALEVEQGNIEYLKVYYVHVNADLTMTLEQTASHALNDIVDITPMTENCYTSGFSDLVTPPLVTSIDTININKLETVVGVATSNTHAFRMIVFASDGSLYDTHPEVLSVSGSKLGNVALADVWAGSYKDYCLSVFTDDNEFKAFCGSRFIGGFLGLGQDDTFTYDISSENNLSYDKAAVIHSIESNSTARTSELLTQYGVMVFDLNEDELRPIYTDAQQDYYIIPIAADTDAEAELLAFDSQNLYLYDSSIVRYGCEEALAIGVNCYETITLNPSPEQAWCINTSFEARVKVFDLDGHDLNVRVEIYANDSNSQDSGWSNAVTSGRTYAAASNAAGERFIANKTGTHLLRIEIRDTDEADQVISYEEYFTVVDAVDACIEYNDVVKTVSGNIDVDAVDLAFTDVDFDQNANVLASFMKQSAEASGFSAAAYLLIISLMVGVSLFIGMIAKGFTLAHSGGSALAVAFAIIVISSILGILSVAWIILPLLLALGGFFVFRLLIPHAGGG